MSNKRSSSNNESNLFKKFKSSPKSCEPIPKSGGAIEQQSMVIQIPKDSLDEVLSLKRHPLLQNLKEMSKVELEVALLLVRQNGLIRLKNKQLQKELNEKGSFVHEFWDKKVEIQSMESINYNQNSKVVGVQIEDVGENRSTELHELDKTVKRVDDRDAHHDNSGAQNKSTADSEIIDLTADEDEIIQQSNEKSMKSTPKIISLKQMQKYLVRDNIEMFQYEPSDNFNQQGNQDGIIQQHPDFDRVQFKHLLPQPLINTVNFVSDTEVLVIWTVNNLTQEMPKIDRYQIYLYAQTVTHCCTDCDNGQLIAEIEANPLPLSICVQMMKPVERKERQNYFFMVRAIDVCGCFSLLSIPKADL